MALSFNGTLVLIDKSQIPAGYVKPVVSTFFDPEYQSVNRELQITKSLVENVSDVVTFTNILDDPTNGINKKIEDLLTNDLDTAGNTIDAYAELRAVRTNQVFKDDLYNDTANTYRCDVRIFFKYA